MVTGHAGAVSDRHQATAFFAHHRQQLFVQRFLGCFVEALAGKRVALLGCGALGSAVAEMVVRAGAAGVVGLGTALAGLAGVVAAPFLSLSPSMSSDVSAVRTASFSTNSGGSLKPASTSRQQAVRTWATRPGTSR